jgi:hypothetical protein
VHTNPLTGARYPDNADATNLATYYQNVVDDLSPQSVPQFGSSAARDSAVSTWTSSGHTFTQGLCLVNGAPQMYRGKWVPLDQTLYRRVAGTATGTLASGASVNLCAAQTIPASPFGTSVGYTVDVDAVAHFTAVPAGLGLTLEIRYDGVAQDGYEFTNGGTSTCKHTAYARSGLTVIDNSTHSVTAVITAQAGTITLDTTYARLLMTIRPYTTF